MQLQRVADDGTLLVLIRSSSQRGVKVVDEFTLPASYVVEATGGPLEAVKVTLHVQVRHGVQRCVRVEADSPAGVTLRDLKRVKVDYLIREAVPLLLWKRTVLDDAGEHFRFDPASSAQIAEAQAPRRRKVTDDDLREAARVWRWARATQTDQPTQAAADLLRVSRSTFARRRTKAHERGFLRDDEINTTEGER